MIPDPSTADTQIGEGGSASPAGERTGTENPSPAGHTCVCGEPIEASLWDMTVFASENTVAYLPCLWA